MSRAQIRVRIQMGMAVGRDGVGMGLWVRAEIWGFVDGNGEVGCIGSKLGLGFRWRCGFGRIRVSIGASARAMVGVLEMGVVTEKPSRWKREEPSRGA